MRDSVVLRRKTIRSTVFVLVSWMTFGCVVPSCSSNESSASNTGGTMSMSSATPGNAGGNSFGGSSSTPAQTSVASSGRSASDSVGGAGPISGGTASSSGGVTNNTSKADANGGTRATATLGGTTSAAGRASVNTGGTGGRTTTANTAGKTATGGTSALTSTVVQAGSSGLGRGGSTSSSSATGGSGSSAGGATSVCLDFPAPTSVGTIEASAGPSGMVASRSNPGVLYAQLDTGGPATVYAITTTGKSLGEYTITGATNTDWEDIAVGPGPSAGSYIYIGDIGDNAARTGGTVRKEIQVYRVPEPKVTTTQTATAQSLAGTEVLRFTYPDAAHDAETLIVDPISGDILIITKETDGNSSIFRAPANTPVNSPTVLETLGTVKIGASGQAAMASGGDASPSGDRFMVRSYTAILIFTRASTLAATFAGTPKSIAFATEPQGEGVTFSADGKSIFTAGETVKTLYQSQATCP